MCRSMVDIQSAAADIRRGKKEDRKKPQGKNIMACPNTYGGHNKKIVVDFSISFGYPTIEKLSASGDSPRPAVHRFLGRNKILATALTNFRSSKIRQFTSNYAQPICTSEGRRCNWPVACYSAFDGLRYNVVITTAVDMSVRQQMWRDDLRCRFFSCCCCCCCCCCCRRQANANVRRIIRNLLAVRAACRRHSRVEYIRFPGCRIRILFWRVNESKVWMQVVTRIYQEMR